MSNMPFDALLASDDFKEEYFVAETQARLTKLLDEKGVSRAELARRLDVSRARISQIFSDEAPNLTLRLMVRSYLALDEEPVVISRSEYEALHQAVNLGSSRQDNSETSADGIAEALIAKLLQANIGDIANKMDRPQKRTSAATDWTSSSTNIIPFQRVAHG